MKLKWKEDAVSPVIATILMVAITVVLAAVLYVMVIGMTGNNGAMTATPVGSWQKMDPISNTSVNMVFGNFQPEVKAFDVRIIIESQTGYIFNLTFPSVSIDSENYTMSSDGLGITAYYYDFNPAGGLIGAGDHIHIYGLKTFTFYEVKIFYFPTESVAQMAGDTNFQTPP